MGLFIGHCPQIRADYFHTYQTNTDDIVNKHSLTRIVGYALKTKKFLTMEEKYHSLSRYRCYRDMSLFIGHCPAYSQIRADYFHTYHTNTDDIVNKHSLTRIVGYALKTRKFLIMEEKYHSLSRYRCFKGF